MTRLFSAALAITLMLISRDAHAVTLTFVDDKNGMFDIFLNPSPNSEFTNFDLVVSPVLGALLDPVRNSPGNAGDYDNVVDGARVDTWANTPFSSLGAGTPSYVFTEYHPGAPPFTPPQEVPSAGGAIDQLNWTVFDTNVGDGPQAGPYHLARVLYTPRGWGNVDIWAFETATVGVGERFNFIYGIVPEPTVGAMVSMIAAAGLIRRQRR